jgi:cytoskeleton protein RodZ
MASTPPQPPDTGEDTSQSAAPRAIAEVSEALNGLRELAERVTPAKPKTLTEEEEEQLAMDLARGEVEEDEAHAITLAKAEPISPPEPIAIVIPSMDREGDHPIDLHHKPEVIAAPVSKKSEPESPLMSRKPRVGETLREARESAGFSLEDVADEIKIKEIYLQAIEEGRYGDLPSRTYAVGFVRSYAQAMGLHTEELVARCRAEVGTVQKIAGPPPLVMREPEADRRLPGGALITVCVVLALIVYAASYSFLRPGANPAYETPTNETTAEVAPQPAPVVAAPAPVAPAPVAVKAPEQTPAPQQTEKAEAPKAAPVEEPKEEAAVSDTSDEHAATDDHGPTVELAPVKKTIDEASNRPMVVPGASAEDVKAMPASERQAAEAAADNPAAKTEDAKLADKSAKKAPSRIKLRAAEDTSVRITDSSGKILAERTIKKGESFYVPDHKHYTLATTNAGGLRLSVDGRDMPALGDVGEAMHNIPLDAADLLQVLAQ